MRCLWNQNLPSLSRWDRAASSRLRELAYCCISDANATSLWHISTKDIHVDVDTCVRSFGREAQYRILLSVILWLYFYLYDNNNYKFYINVGGLNPCVHLLQLPCSSDAWSHRGPQPQAKSATINKIKWQQWSTKTAKKRDGEESWRQRSTIHDQEARYATKHNDDAVLVSFPWSSCAPFNFMKLKYETNPDAPLYLNLSLYLFRIWNHLWIKSVRCSVENLTSKWAFQITAIHPSLLICFFQYIAVSFK